MITLNQASENCESNAGANLLGPLQSPPAVLDDANFQLTYSSVCNRPRTTNIYIVPHDSAVSESNCTEEPALLESSLKRLCREVKKGDVSITLFNVYFEICKKYRNWNGSSWGIWLAMLLSTSHTSIWNGNWKVGKKRSNVCDTRTIC